MQDDSRAARSLRDGCCPDCGSRSMIAGPRGGASQNIICPICFTRWNAHGIEHGIFAVDRETISGDEVRSLQEMYPHTWHGLASR